MRIIDQAHERFSVARLGQQVQDREGHQEAIRRSTILQPERDTQSCALRTWQPVQPIKHGRAHLIEPREGELDLGLNAPDPDDPTSRRPPGDVVQQRRLADPGLAAQDQHLASTRARFR